MLTRKRVEYSGQLTRVRNHIEGLLEKAQLKITGVLSDLLGLSGRRILQALAGDQSDPVALAQLADARVHASQEKLAAALAGNITDWQRLLLRQDLSTIELLEQPIEQVSAALVRGLEQHGAVMERCVGFPVWECLPPSRSLPK